MVGEGRGRVERERERERGAWSVERERRAANGRGILRTAEMKDLGHSE